MRRLTVFSFTTGQGNSGFGVVLANREQLEMSPSWRIGYVSYLYTLSVLPRGPEACLEVMLRSRRRIRTVPGPLGFRRRDLLPMAFTVEELYSAPFFLAYVCPDPRWDLEVLFLSRKIMSGIPFARIRKYTGHYFFATCLANSPYIHNRIDVMTRLGIDHDLLYARFMMDNPSPGPLGIRADSLWSNVDVDFEIDVEFAYYVESEVSG